MKNLYFNPIQELLKKKQKKENITWFYPPFNKSVSTNLGSKLLNLVDKHFPKATILGKIFNKNTIKVSYSCLPNMEKIISSHNKKILREHQVNTLRTNAPNCNCRKGVQSCPLRGECLSKSIIYRAEVISKTGPGN